MRYFILNHFYHPTASRVTSWPYEKAPCNVLVDESSGISVAKSTLEDLSLVRPKPSISTAAAQSSGTTSADNTQSSPINGAVTGGTAAGRLKRKHRNKRNAVDDGSPLVLLEMHESSNNLVGDGVYTTTQFPLSSLEHGDVEDETSERSTKLLSVTNKPEINVFEEITASSPLAEISRFEIFEPAFDEMLPQNDGPMVDSEPVGIDFVSLENLNRNEPSVHTMDKEEPLQLPLVPYIVETHPADHVKYEFRDADSYPEHNGEQNKSDTQESNSMQRILVNVSIATDSGSGTQHHAVYMLHVSVPAGPQFIFDHTKVDENNTNSATAKNEEQPTPGNVADEISCQPPDPPPVPPCPCECSSPQTEEDIEIYQYSTESGISLVHSTPALSEMENKSIENTSIDPSLACLYAQEIPTILILEGEPIIRSDRKHIIQRID